VTDMDLFRISLSGDLYRSRYLNAILSKRLSTNQNQAHFPNPTQVTSTKTPPSKSISIPRPPASGN